MSEIILLQGATLISLPVEIILLIAYKLDIYKISNYL